MSQDRVWACCGDRLFDGEQVRPGYAVIVRDALITDIVPARSVPGEMERLLPMLAEVRKTGLPMMMHCADRPQIAAVVKDGAVHRPDDLRRASAAFVATVETEPWGINFREKAGS